MNRIKQLREERKMTQVRLSIELGVTQETVSAYETGKHYPSAQQLIKLSRLFQASVDYILEVSDIRLPERADCIPEGEAMFLSLYRSITEGQREKAIAYISGMLEG